MNYADPRDANYIASANQPHSSALASDYAALGDHSTPRHRDR